MSRVFESYDARISKMNANGSTRSAELTYVVLDAADEEAALDAVRAKTAASYRNVPLSYVEIITRDNDTTFHVRAVYEAATSSGGGSSSDDDDTPTMSFDCGGGQRHVQTALYQTHYGNHSAYNDIKLIGWNGKTGSDMQVAGVDVPTAQMRLAFTKTLSYGEVTDSRYMRKCGNLVGFVNRDKFKTWNPGEVMFLGNSFSTATRRVNKVAVTFHFAIQLAETKKIKLAGSAAETTITKKGFEYVWIIPKIDVKEISSVKTPVIEIDDFFVAGVIEAKDFSALGI